MGEIPKPVTARKIALRLIAMVREGRADWPEGWPSAKIDPPWSLGPSIAGVEFTIGDRKFSALVTEQGDDGRVVLRPPREEDSTTE